MGLIKNIRNIFRRESGGAGIASLADAPYLAGAGGGSATGISTVYCCLKLISESVAQMPLRCYRRRGTTTETDTAMDYVLNIQPDATLSGFDFWRGVVHEVLMDGNAYIVPVYDPESLALHRLVLCRRGTVVHDCANDLYTVSDALMGVSGTYGEADIIHIKGSCPSNNPKHGLGILAYARQTFRTVSAGNREMYQRFATGGMRGLLTGHRNLRGFSDYDAEEVERFADSINARIDSNRFGVAYIPGEFELKQLNQSAADMQFLETMKFNVQEICRFFNVDPSFVYAGGATNYKSAENATSAFLNTTLNPLLRNIENELQRKLISPSLASEIYFEFDRWALYATNISARLDIQGKAMGVGLRTVNELRAAAGSAPVPEGDTVLVSANYKPIKQ